MTSPISAGAWATVAAALIAASAAIFKRTLPHYPKYKSDFITRAEFYSSIDSLRAHLADKLDRVHRDSLAKFDSIETRLDHLDTSIARLDERTSQPR